MARKIKKPIQSTKLESFFSRPASTPSDPRPLQSITNFTQSKNSTQKPFKLPIRSKPIVIDDEDDKENSASSESHSSHSILKSDLNRSHGVFDLNSINTADATSRTSFKSESPLIAGFLEPDQTPTLTSTSTQPFALHTEERSPDSPTIRRKRSSSQEDFQAIVSVICVSRRSSTQKENIVKRLEDNNAELYAKFQAKYHRTLHTCEAGQCPAEFISIVINGLSSNHDVTMQRSGYVKKLQNALEDFAAQGDKVSAVIIFSQEDGLFTNVEGLYALFTRYQTYTIYFLMYEGGSSFQEYLLSDLLEAIEEIKEGISLDNACHRLVRTWAAVSLNKLNMGVLVRDNKRMMPRWRNDVDDDSDSDDDATSSQDAPSSNSSIVSYSSGAKTLRLVAAAEKRSSSVQKYGLEKRGEKLVCPQETCLRTFSTFDQLVTHLTSRCRMTSHCVLCPDNRKVSSWKPHVISHLPPQLACDVPGCPYKARQTSALKTHKAAVHDGKKPDKKHWCKEHNVGFVDKVSYQVHINTVHEGLKNFKCPFCGESYGTSSYLGVHIRDWCKKTTRDPADYQCPDCGASGFTTYKHMAKHRYDLHTRREQIVGFAIEAGIIAGNDPSNSAFEDDGQD